MASIGAEAPDRMLATLEARRRRKERLVRTVVLVAAAGLSVVVSVSIVLALTFERSTSCRTWVFLVALRRASGDRGRVEFDLISLFYGSLVVTSIAMIVTAPLGLGAAAYLSSTRSRARRKLKPISRRSWASPASRPVLRLSR